MFVFSCYLSTASQIVIFFLRIARYTFPSSDGLAGMRGERSLRKDGFAGTGQAAFPTIAWPERVVHVSYKQLPFSTIRVGDGCHAIPQATVGRDVCINEVDKLLVGKGSDSYFVYFASLRSE